MILSCCQSCLETGDFTFFNSAVTFNKYNFWPGCNQNGHERQQFGETPAEGIPGTDPASAGLCLCRIVVFVDPRYTYVNRGCAEYVEHLGTHENEEPGLGIRTELRPEDH